MLVKIADRREVLTLLEKQLQTLDRTRAAKKDELRQLERKLVQCLSLWDVGVSCFLFDDGVEGVDIVLCLK